MTIYKPAQSSDDAHLEVVETPSFYLASMSIPLGGTAVDDYRNGGFRFPVPILSGTTIASAKMTLRASGSSAAVCNFRIKGDDADDSVTFSTWPNYVGRTRTTAFVDWSPTAWTIGLDYDSPDITSIVQEIVNRVGFTNHLTIFIENIATSFGFRNCVSYDSSTVNCARLEIITSVPGPTMDQIMRGGKWFNGGTFQGFWLGWR